MLREVSDFRTAVFVQERGVDVQYYASRLCSCIAQNNGVRDPECDCIGGYYYDDPKIYRVLVTSRKFLTRTHQAGVFLQGSANVTIPRYAIGPDGTLFEMDMFSKINRGDVIVLPSSFHRDTDILTKGIRDEIWTFNIQTIHRISQEKLIYREGIDYSFIDTTIIWHPENGSVPEDDTAYAVEFTSNQQYLVWDDGAGSRGVEGQQLPKRVLCQLRPYGSIDKSPIDTVDLSQDPFMRTS